MKPLDLLLQQWCTSAPAGGALQAERLVGIDAVEPGEGRIMVVVPGGLEPRLAGLGSGVDEASVALAALQEVDEILDLCAPLGRQGLELLDQLKFTLYAGAEPLADGEDL